MTFDIEIDKASFTKEFINKFYSVQPDSSTKHIAGVRPSQYIAKPLCEQMSKSNCSSCSSHTSYISHPKSSKVFIWNPKIT